MSTPSQAAPRRGIIWDLDGTLTMTVPVHRESWRRTYLTFGIAFGDEDERLTAGLPRASGALEVFRRARPDFCLLPAEKQQALIDYASALKQVHFLAVLREAQEPAVDFRLEPAPGVRQLLPRLARAGWGLAVGSSSRNARDVLQAAGLSPHFQVVVTPQDVPGNSPTKTDVFRAAAERLGLPPADLIVIEDAVHGVRAAHEADLPCVAVTTTETEQQLRDAGADEVVRDPSCITADLLERVIDRYRARAPRTEGAP
jgi:HAD superfamily hydrolase (TIGR01509 family)